MPKINSVKYLTQSEKLNSLFYDKMVSNNPGKLASPKRIISCTEW